MSFRILLLLSVISMTCGRLSAQSPSQRRMEETRDLTAMSERIHLLSPQERIDLEKQLSYKVLWAYRQGQSIEYRVWSRALKRLRAARGAPIDRPRHDYPAYYQSYQPPHFNYIAKFGYRQPTINLNWRSTEGYGGWIK